MNIQETTYFGTAAIDWLTLTTSKTSDHKLIVNLLERVIMGTCALGRGKKLMQYEGNTGDTWFVGVGEQQGVPHYMVQAWGATADALGFEVAKRGLLSAGVKCTRIDVQRTEPVESYPALHQLGEYLENCSIEQWNLKSKRPRIDYHYNHDGRHTLYVGSRSSRRFTRFYNAEKGGRQAVRMEVEYKREAAASVWEVFDKRGREGLNSLLRFEQRVYPRRVADVLAALWQWDCLALDAIEVPLQEQSLESTWRWYEEQVLPSMSRFLKSPRADELREALTCLVAQ